MVFTGHPVEIYIRRKMYTATLSPNVLPGVRSQGEGDESSRTMKINANIQLGGMKEGERNEERNVVEY